MSTALTSKTTDPNYIHDGQDWSLMNAISNTSSKKRKHPPAPKAAKKGEYNFPKSPVNVVYSMCEADPVKIQREDISIPTESYMSKDAAKLVDNAFLLSPLLSVEECAYLMKAANPLTRDLTPIYTTDFRSGQRALVRAPTLAAELFKRVIPCLKETDWKGRTPMCFGQGGAWIPLGFNECIKFVKYTEHDQFSYHRDSPWIPREDQASIYTLVIYLSDDFVGGSTCLSHRCVVSPVTGMGLVFNHDLMHAGEEVRSSSPKWILRTEMIFQRVHWLYIDKYAFTSLAEYQECRKLYEESVEAMNKGDRDAFLNKYQTVLEAQRTAMLDVSTEQAKMVRILAKCNADVLSSILMWLGDADLVRLLLVSRGTYYDVIQSSAWQFKCLDRFPKSFACVARDSVEDILLRSAGQFKNSVPLDWFTLYAQRCVMTKRFFPSILWPHSTGSYVAHSVNSRAITAQKSATERKAYLASEESRFDTLPAAIVATVPEESRISIDTISFVNLKLPPARMMVGTYHMNRGLEVGVWADCGEENAVVTTDGEVHWGKMYENLPEGWNYIWRPLLLLAHPHWYLGKEDGVKKQSDAAMTVLRVPAVAAVHPAACLVAAKYASERGDVRWGGQALPADEKLPSASNSLVAVAFSFGENVSIVSGAASMYVSIVSRTTLQVFSTSLLHVKEVEGGDLQQFPKNLADLLSWTTISQSSKDESNDCINNLLYCNASGWRAESKIFKFCELGVQQQLGREFQKSSERNHQLWVGVLTKEFAERKGGEEGSGGKKLHLDTSLNEEDVLKGACLLASSIDFRDHCEFRV